MSHSEKAVEYFKSGYNCSQSVFCAFCGELGIPFDTAVKISSSFGGGMGRLREVCGALSGSFMVIGALFGGYDPHDRTAKTQHYQRIQEFANEFKEQNGSIICRELLGLDIKGADDPKPQQRTQKYYKKRPCAELVRMCAEMLEKKYF